MKKVFNIHTDSTNNKSKNGIINKNVDNQTNKNSNKNSSSHI